METLEAPDEPSKETDAQDRSETDSPDDSQQKDEDLW
jgi:hypothetical protein